MITHKENHVPIMAVVYDPSGPSLFKSSKNEPAKCTVYFCEKADTCPLLKVGQCINYGILGPKCPHGYLSQETGYSRRAKNFRSWINDRTEKWKDYKRIKGYATKKLACVGDWIYLPYAHMDMNESVPFKGHSAAFVTGSPFLKPEDFTIENIEKIVNFRPHALFGGEITDYQRKEVPLFLLHLQESYPHLYKQLIEIHPEYITRYAIEKRKSVGRKALLKTTNPAEVTVHKEKFQWDGKQLKSKTYRPLFLNVNDINGREAIEEMETIITPTDTTAIIIENESQVTEKTVFVD